MKTFTILFLLILANHNVSAQGVEASSDIKDVNSVKSFVVLNVGTKYSKTQIKKAFSLVDWCGYHFDSSRHKITLDDGSVVEFKSANELDNISQECVSVSFEDSKIYSIHPSNRIIIRVEKDADRKTFSRKQ